MLNDTNAAAAVTPINGEVIRTYDDARQLLRSARNENGLSTAQLAEKLGCAASLVSLRETGKRMPPTDDTIDTFRKLGKVLVLVDADTVSEKPAN